MKRLLDIVVLVAAINPNDKSHQKARRHLQVHEGSKETFVPAVMLIEFCLELKKQMVLQTKKRLIVFKDPAPILSVHKNFPQKERYHNWGSRKNPNAGRGNELFR
jgi:predicted nucleic acid-binding protein